MKPRDLALLVLLGGAAYYLLRRNPATGRSLADDLFAGLPLQPTGAFGSGGPGGYYAPAPPTSANRNAQIAGLVTSGAMAAIPLFTGGTAAAAAGGGGAAAGAGAGIGLAGALTAAGIAGGAAILAWGIISKGWFRGGEEALKVSPARDAYAKEFRDRYGIFAADGDYTQQWAGFVRAGGEAGMPGYEVDRMLRRINKADKVAEWQAATDDATATFNAYAALSGATAIPEWRQRQLQGEMIFANGQNQSELIASTRALGGDYSDLVADYSRPF